METATQPCRMKHGVFCLPAYLPKSRYKIKQTRHKLAVPGDFFFICELSMARCDYLLIFPLNILVN